MRRLPLFVLCCLAAVTWAPSALSQSDPSPFEASMLRAGVFKESMNQDQREERMFQSAFHGGINALASLQELKRRGLDNDKWHGRYVRLLYTEGFRGEADRYWLDLGDRREKVEFPSKNKPEPIEIEFLDDPGEVWASLLKEHRLPGAVDGLAQTLQTSATQTTFTYPGIDPLAGMNLWSALDSALLGLTPARRKPLVDASAQAAGPLRSVPQDGAEVVRSWRAAPFEASRLEALTAWGEACLREGRPALARQCFHDVLAHDPPDAVKSRASDGLVLAVRGVEAVRPTPQPRLVPGSVAPGEPIGVPVVPLWNATVVRKNLPFPGVSLQQVGGNGLLVAAPRLLAYYASGRFHKPVWTRRADASSFMGFTKNGHNTELRVSGALVTPAVDRGVVVARWGFDDMQSDMEPRRQLLTGVAGFELETGRMLWSSLDHEATAHLTVASDPVASEGRAYFLAGGEQASDLGLVSMVCLDVRTGKPLWTTPLGRDQTLSLRGQSMRFGFTPSSVVGGYLNAPTVDQGAVLATTAAGDAVACDARDGLYLWRRRFEPTRDRDQWETLRGAPPMVVDGKVVMLNRQRSGVVVVDRRTGERLWEDILLPAGDGLIGVSDGLLFLREGQKLTAVTLADGSIRWWQTLPSDIVGPAILQDGALLVSTGRTLHWFDAKTGSAAGEEPWKGPEPLDHGLAIGNRLYGINPVDRTNDVPADAQAGEEMGTVKLIADDGPRLWLMRDDDILEARNLAADGRLLWRRFAPQSDIVPIRGGVCLSRRGHLTAVADNDGHTLWQRYVEQDLNEQVNTSRVDAQTAYNFDDLVLLHVKINSIEDAILAYETRSGEIRWSHRFEKRSKEYERNIVSFARDKDQVLCYMLMSTTDKGQIETFNARTGEKSSKLDFTRQGLPEELHRRGALADGEKMRMDLPAPREKRDWVFTAAGNYLVERYYKNGNPTEYHLVVSRPGKPPLSVKVPDDLYDADFQVVDDELFVMHQHQINVYDLKSQKQTRTIRVAMESPKQLTAVGDRLVIAGKEHAAAMGLPNRHYSLEVLERASGRSLGKVVLPTVAGNDVRANVVLTADAMWYADGRSLRSLAWRDVEKQGLALGVPRTLLRPANLPISIDGHPGDWDALTGDSVKRWSLDGGGELRIAHDANHLLLMARRPDAVMSPMRGEGRFGGSGDRLEIKITTDRPGFELRGSQEVYGSDHEYLPFYNWDVGVDTHGRTILRRLDKQDPQDIVTRIRHDDATGEVVYETAIALEDIRKNAAAPVWLGVSMWDDQATDRAVAVLDEQPINLHPYMAEQDRGALRLASALPFHNDLYTYPESLLNGTLLAWPGDQEQLRWMLSQLSDSPFALLFLGELAVRFHDLDPSLDKPQVLGRIREEASAAGLDQALLRHLEQHYDKLTNRGRWSKFDNEVRRAIGSVIKPIYGEPEKLDADTIRKLIRDELLPLAKTPVGVLFYSGLMEQNQLEPDEALRETIRFLHAAGGANPELDPVLVTLVKLIKQVTPEDQRLATLGRIISSTRIPAHVAYRGIRREQQWQNKPALRNWHILGPLPDPAFNPGSQATRYPPDLEAITLKEFYSHNDKTVRWQKVPPQKDGVIDLLQLMGFGTQAPPEICVAYAVTWVYSAQAQTVALDLNHTHDAKLWINRRPIALHPIYAHETRAQLDAGWNQVLVELHSFDPGPRSDRSRYDSFLRGGKPKDADIWGFQLNVTDPLGYDSPPGTKPYEPQP